MHEIIVGQFVDDDDNVITTAATDPDALSYSVYTNGEAADVYADEARLRPLGGAGLSELLVTCGQAAFLQRYDPLLSKD
ncbi:hypothetical protein QDT91_28610 (plasmid) [Mycolicibacterium aubagnense]|jgi:hypothetical protein|uniref:hypothetical protein n=1 Tax=Mycolicibacterium aubagnense TaxID=319707 RepID=UPI0013F645F3|nr:hypothetical protein [Mycolicibacterium aubagnense]WGI35972.1 hypothetical protein QDT91_28610 [Mycolicibacterium aubagnense]